MMWSIASLQGQIDHIFFFEPLFLEPLGQLHRVCDVAEGLQFSLKVATFQTEYAIGQCIMLLFG